MTAILTWIPKTANKIRTAIVSVSAEKRCILDRAHAPIVLSEQVYHMLTSRCANRVLTSFCVRARPHVTGRAY
jgi:hypothetical protein